MGSTTTFEYDKLSRLIKKHNTVSGTVYYAYDASGRRISLKDPDLKETKYVWDTAGRLEKVEIDGARTAYFHHDASGLLEKKILPGDAVITYFTYDNAGRVASLVNRNENLGGVISSNVYTRNANGAIEKIEQQFGQWSYFEYDNNERLIREEVRDAFQVVRHDEYSYDVASNRTIRQDVKNSENSYFTYDALNLISKAWNKEQAETHYFAFDDSQRMTSDRNPSDQSTYFTHDQRDLLTKLEFARSASADATREFSYSGTGERIRAKNGSSETYWAWDGPKLITEREPDGTLVGRYRFNQNARNENLLLEVEAPDLTSPTLVYPAVDDRNSVHSLQDDSEQVDLYFINRWGQVTADLGASDQRDRFIPPAILELSTQNTEIQLGGMAGYLPEFVAPTLGSGTGMVVMLGGGGGVFSVLSALPIALPVASPLFAGPLLFGLQFDPVEDFLGQVPVFPLEDTDFTFQPGATPLGPPCKAESVRRFGRGKIEAKLVRGLVGVGINPPPPVSNLRASRDPAPHINTVQITYTPTNRLRECCSEIRFVQIAMSTAAGFSPDEAGNLHRVPAGQWIVDDLFSGKTWYGGDGGVPWTYKGKTPYASMHDSASIPRKKADFTAEACAICVSPREAEPESLHKAILGCVEWGFEIRNGRTKVLWIGKAQRDNNKPDLRGRRKNFNQVPYTGPTEGPTGRFIRMIVTERANSFGSKGDFFGRAR